MLRIIRFFQGVRRTGVSPSTVPRTDDTNIFHGGHTYQSVVGGEAGTVVHAFGSTDGGAQALTLPSGQVERSSVSQAIVALSDQDTETPFGSIGEQTLLSVSGNDPATQTSAVDSEQSSQSVGANTQVEYQGLISGCRKNTVALKVRIDDVFKKLRSLSANEEFLTLKLANNRIMGYQMLLASQRPSLEKQEYGLECLGAGLPLSEGMTKKEFDLAHKQSLGEILPVYRQITDKVTQPLVALEDVCKAMETHDWAKIVEFISAAPVLPDKGAEPSSAEGTAQTSQSADTVTQDVVDEFTKEMSDRQQKITALQGNIDAALTQLASLNDNENKSMVEYQEQLTDDRSQLESKKEALGKLMESLPHSGGMAKNAFALVLEQSLGEILPVYRQITDKVDKLRTAVEVMHKAINTLDWQKPVELNSIAPQLPEGGTGPSSAVGSAQTSQSADTVTQADVGQFIKQMRAQQNFCIARAEALQKKTDEAVTMLASLDDLMDDYKRLFWNNSIHSKKQIKAMNELMASLQDSLGNPNKAFPLRDVQSLAEIFAANNQTTDTVDKHLAKLREVYQAMDTLYQTQQPGKNI